MAHETDTERAVRERLEAGVQDIRADEQFSRCAVDASVDALHRRRTRQAVVLGVAAALLTVAAVVLPDRLTRDSSAPADPSTDQIATTSSRPSVPVSNWSHRARPARPQAHPRRRAP